MAAVDVANTGPNLLPIVVGGILVWVGTLIADRRKTKSTDMETLRRAYANWFAAESILVSRIGAVSISIRTIPEGRTQHEAAMTLLRDVEADFRPLFTALNDAYLLEQRLPLKGILSRHTEALEGTLQALNFIAQHYQSHIEARENREKISERLLHERQQGIRDILQKQVDLITEWDEKCAFNSPEHIDSLVSTLRDLHGTILVVRDLLTPTSLFERFSEHYTRPKSLQQRENRVETTSTNGQQSE